MLFEDEAERNDPKNAAWRKSATRKRVWYAYLFVLFTIVGLICAGQWYELFDLNKLDRNGDLLGLLMVGLAFGLLAIFRLIEAAQRRKWEQERKYVHDDDAKG